MKNTHLPTGWQEVKLGDIATIIKVKNKENKNYPVLSNSAIYGVVLQEEYFYKKIASKNDTTNYYIVDIGNFIYNPRISENAPAGPINVNKLTKGIVSPLYTVFYVKKEYSDFIAFYLSSSLWVNYLKEIANYGARYDRLGINDKMLLSIPILLPPLEEQKRIAEVLSLCDEVIENLTELIEKKEQYKKGVMQRLLSGEVRFKGFTDEWKVFKLKEIGNIISGSGFPIKYQGKQIGEIAFIKVSDMNLKDNSIFIQKANNYINENELKELKAKIVPIDSIVFAKIGEAVKLERKRIISIKTCIDNNMSALVPFDNFNKKYIFYLLNNYKLSKHLNFSALPSLNMSDILDIEFLMPNIEEQNKISSFFSVIDEEIENLKKQLELRKQQKKGLMQRLLTGEVRI